ncbi:DNA-processing protein DprA [Pseudoalteromonas sp. T1lg22]|uniref:DNA-processing protein DprA n=1 Tax=Pseudoalteromonas sp. T1lg22 TaxID=2077096 RepID=UPI001F334820|nr:DNA-processing protein DprA [Pseudoalteromonas sp. T1lg22]
MTQSESNLSASSEADLFLADANLLALMRTPGLGLRSAYTLLQHIPILDLVADAEVLIEAGLRRDIAAYLATAKLEPLQQELSEYRHQGIAVISLANTLYPPLLKELPDPPLLLFCIGNSRLLAQPQVAIVGSRGASIGGKHHAFEFAAQLSDAGLAVTSGMAMGIDASAHLGALHNGGATLAVLGTGVDLCYPRRNKALREQIAQHGLLVSEFLPGTQPRAQHFPRRNRVIAGLSLGTLVVEAEQKSGSLITAELAMDYNREVMAMPGAVNNPYSRGCHALIKHGAALVENAEDVLAELGCYQQKGLYINNEGVEKEDENTLLRHIGFEPTSIDAIALSSQIPIAQLLTLLIDLELEGSIISTSGGYTRVGGE